MDINAIKSILLRHCEKGILALVILFVGHSVYSRLTSTEEAVLRSLRPPVIAPEAVTEAVRPAFFEASQPFVMVPDAAAAIHDWFHWPRSQWLKHVTLQMISKETDSRNAGSKVDGQPIPYVPSAAEIATLGLLTDGDDIKEPCEVAVGVDPSDPRVLTFKAAKPGNWKYFIATLQNQDRVKMAVIVRPAGWTDETKVPEPAIKQVKEEPLGTVVLHFTVPQGTMVDPAKHLKLRYLEPLYYRVLRKGEHDSQEREVGRVPGRTPPKTPAEGGPEARPAPRAPAPEAGFPGAVPKGAPKPAAGPPRPRPAPEALEPGTMVYQDRDVESETAYTYRVVSVVAPAEEGEQERTAASAPAEIKTADKFSFAYVGGGAYSAKIVVFVGPRERPLDVKVFTVPIGGRVGDLPREVLQAGAPAAAAGAPDAGAPAAAAPAAGNEDAGARFVTRYILVNIEQDVLHLVPQSIRVVAGADATGRPQFRDVNTYREMFDRQVILRDRKNRLIRLWTERTPALSKLAGE